MGYRWAREQVDEANTAATTYGGADAVVQAATAGSASMPGAPVVGPLGAVFSGLGLGGNLAEMYDTGVTPENVADASGNAAGVVSGIAGLAGSTMVAPAAATYAAVVGLLRGGNDTLGESGLLGKKNPEYEDPRENRDPTDAIADEGRAGRELARTVGFGERFAQIYGVKEMLEALPGATLMAAGAGTYRAAESMSDPGTRTGLRALRVLANQSREEPLLAGIGEQIHTAGADQ